MNGKTQTNSIDEAKNLNLFMFELNVRRIENAFTKYRLWQANCSQLLTYHFCHTRELISIYSHSVGPTEENIEPIYKMHETKTLMFSTQPLV